jgi:hypothetical protein
MDKRRFAALVRTEVTRPPTGLAKFPDGGAEKIDDQFVTVYVGDVDSGTVRPLGKVSAPKEVWTAFQTTLLGMKTDGVYAVLTGCAKPDCGKTPPTRVYYRFGFDGAVQRLDERPVDVERQPGMLSRSPGETVYTRVGTHGDSVTALTVDNGRFVPRFVLIDGELRPIPPSNKH